MLLTCPAVKAGQDVVFTVTQEGYGVVGEVTCKASEGQACAVFSGWFGPEHVTNKAELKDGERFPEVSFTFKASSNGKGSPASAPLAYGDAIDTCLTAASEGEEPRALADTECTLYSPWGKPGKQDG